MTADTSQAVTSIRQAEAAMGNFTKKASQEGNQLDEVFKKVAKAAASMGIAFSAKQFISDLVKVRGEFQQTEIAFETMLGSADKANALVAQLTDTAAKTPFGMTDVTQGAKQLLAYGFAAEEVNDTIVRLGNVASGLSVPLNDLVYLYGTTMTQGRVFTQDMRQFMGRGIPLADELAKQFGVSKDKVNELVTAGKVGFPEVKKAIESMTNEGGKFYNLMLKQSASLTGQTSNLKDAVEMMKNEIGKSVQDIAAGAISTASKLVENYDKVGKVVAAVITTYGSYKAASLVLNAIEGVRDLQLTRRILLVKNYTKTLGFATAAQKAFNLASKANVYAALGSAVLGVAAAIFTFNKRQGDAVKTTGEASRKINEETEALKELFEAAKDQTKSEKERAEAIETINARYGDKLSNMLSEKATVEELTTAYQHLAAAITDAYLAELKESMTGTHKVVYEDYGLNPLYANIQKLAEKSGLSKNRQGAMVAEMQKWISENGEQSDVESIRGALKDIYTKYGGKEQKINYWRDTIYSPVYSYKQTLSSLRKAEAAYNEFAAGYKSVTTGITEDGKRTAEEQRKTLAGIVADIENNLKKVKTLQAKATKEGLTDKEQKELEDATNAADEGKKQYKAFTGREYGKEDDSEAKLAKQRKDAAKAEAREMQDLEDEVTQAEIDAMADGAEKVRRQRELDNKLELQQIERAKEDYIDAVVERARAIHEAEQNAELSKDSSYKKKEFDEAGARKTAENSDGAKQYDKAIAYTEGRQGADRRKEEAEQREAEEAAWREYLIEYGNYEEKKLAITQKYDTLIAEAETKGERESLGKEKEAELYELEREYKKTATAIQDLFGDMSKKSSKDLYGIADAGEQALEFLKGGKYEDGNAFGISPEAFAQISQSPEKLAEIAEAIENIREQADALQTPTEKIAAGFKKMFSAASNTKEFQKGLEMLQAGVGKYTEAAGFISDSLSSMGEALGNEGMTNASAGIDSALNVVDSTMQGLEVGSAFGPWGAAIGAVVGLATSLVTEISKAKDAAKQVNIDNWQKEIDDLNESYAELNEKIDKAYSVDKADLIEAQTKNLEAQNANLEKMIAEEESKKDSDSAQIEAWRKQIKENERIIEDNAEKAQEAINGISFDSFRDKFKDAIMDMEGDAEDWSKSVNDIIRNALVDKLLDEEFEKQSQGLLDDMADAIESGDAAKFNSLKAAYDRLYEEYRKKVENVDEFTGYKSESTRSATAKGIAQASQDSVDELNGRMTAMQSHTFSINERVGNIVNLSSQMLSKLTSIDANTARLGAIEDAMKYMRDDLSTIRTKGITMKA